MMVTTSEPAGRPVRVVWDAKSEPATTATITLSDPAIDDRMLLRVRGLEAALAHGHTSIRSRADYYSLVDRVLAKLEKGSMGRRKIFGRGRGAVTGDR